MSRESAAGPGKVVPFRLAFRAEGPVVNCYFAPPNGMEGAILLASFSKTALTLTPGAFEEWQVLMRKVADASARAAGINMDAADWKTIVAPEAERAGEA